jgi:hypothetical protein
MAMANREDVEHADRVLRDLRGKQDIPFGGVVFVGLGGFRQIPPVVSCGDENEIISSSIVSSSLWPSFNVRSLTIQFRVSEDAAHEAFVNSLGDGTIPLLNFNDDPVNNVALVAPDGRPYSFTTDTNEAISFAFPDPTNMNDTVRSRILSPYNNRCNEINSDILSRLPGQVHVLLSSDSLSGEGRQQSELGNAGEQARDQTDWLHLLDDNTVPQHRLILKVSAMVMLMKTISFSEGIANNVLAVVRGIHGNVVEIETIDTTTGWLSGKCNYPTRHIYIQGVQS